ncbi:MAG: hypothetical protein R6V85_01150 [Polyangia bacterium]
MTRLRISTLLALLALVAACGNRMIVRDFEDAETGFSVRCTGSDWGGNGVPQGYWICSWPNGERYSEGRYQEGTKVGRWVYYDRHGHILHAELWENGRIVASEFGDRDAEGEGFSSSWNEIDATGD